MAAGEALGDVLMANKNTEVRFSNDEVMRVLAQAAGLPSARDGSLRMVVSYFDENRVVREGADAYCTLYLYENVPTRG